MEESTRWFVLGPRRRAGGRAAEGFAVCDQGVPPAEGCEHGSTGPRQHRGDCRRKSPAAGSTDASPRAWGRAGQPLGGGCCAGLLPVLRVRGSEHRDARVSMVMDGLASLSALPHSCVCVERCTRSRDVRAGK